MTNDNPPGEPASAPQWAEVSHASTAMLLSIVGLLSCGLLSPVGMVMADRELDAIAEGRRDPANEKAAKMAKGIGAFGTTILTFVILSAVSLGAIALIF